MVVLKELHPSFSYFWEDFRAQFSIGRFKKFSISWVHVMEFDVIVFLQQLNAKSIYPGEFWQNLGPLAMICFSTAIADTLPYISHLNSRFVPEIGMLHVQTCPQNNRPFPSKWEQWGNNFSESNPWISDVWNQWSASIYENSQHCQTTFHNWIALLHLNCNLKLLLK